MFQTHMACISDIVPSWWYMYLFCGILRFFHCSWSNILVFCIFDMHYRLHLMPWYGYKKQLGRCIHFAIVHWLHLFDRYLGFSRFSSHTLCYLIFKSAFRNMMSFLKIRHMHLLVLIKIKKTDDVFSNRYKDQPYPHIQYKYLDIYS